MHLSTLVEMIESGLEDRALLQHDGPVTGAELVARARAGAASLDGATALAYVGENHPLLPVALLAAALAGVAFVPVNYRLEDEQVHELLDRQPGAVVLADPRTASRLAPRRAVRTLDDWLAVDARAEGPAIEAPATDDDQVAIVLYTSGTTAAPKSALLRQRHLMAYLLGTVDFASAGEDEAVLVSVPPYHIAGMANLLSNLVAGRRLVYLRTFAADRWLDTVRRERITHAMVVPTMLARIVDHLDGAPAEVPTLRSLSYGGAKIAERVVRDALVAFGDTGFVNAYGLTETASTVAVLGPEDHREALHAEDPAVRRRLASAGRLLPTVEAEVRDEDGRPVPAGGTGLLHVRGEQIAGEYATGSVLDADGWFCTRDRVRIDADGYVFIEGRADDTIIRGGENIAPAEIEDVLLEHPTVAQACVVGVPDEEWGQRILAVVVPSAGATIDAEALRTLVRDRLRGSKTPEAVVVRDALPHTDTGKLLRRAVAAELAAAPAAP